MNVRALDVRARVYGGRMNACTVAANRGVPTCERERGPQVLTRVVKRYEHEAGGALIGCERR